MVNTTEEDESSSANEMQSQFQLKVKTLVDQILDAQRRGDCQKPPVAKRRKGRHNTMPAAPDEEEVMEQIGEGAEFEEEEEEEGARERHVETLE